MACEVYLLYGRADWEELGEDVSMLAADATLIGIDAGDGMSGFSGLAMCDLNADGLGDLLIGAANASGEGNADSMAGEVYVLYGRMDWEALYDLAQDPPDALLFGAQDYDFFGSSLQCADLNEDS